MRVYHITSILVLLIAVLFTILALSQQHKGWFEREDAYRNIWYFGLKGYCINPLMTGLEQLNGCHWYEDEPPYAPIMNTKGRKLTDAGNVSSMIFQS